MSAPLRGRLSRLSMIKQPPASQKVVWSSSCSWRDRTTKISMYERNRQTNENYKPWNFLSCGGGGIVFFPVCRPLRDRKLASYDLLCSRYIFGKDWWSKGVLTFFFVGDLARCHRWTERRHQVGMRSSGLQISFFELPFALYSLPL